MLSYANVCVYLSMISISRDCFRSISVTTPVNVDNDISCKFLSSLVRDAFTAGTIKAANSDPTPKPPAPLWGCHKEASSLRSWDGAARSCNHLHHGKPTAINGTPPHTGEGQQLAFYRTVSRGFLLPWGHQPLGDIALCQNSNVEQPMIRQFDPHDLLERRYRWHFAWPKTCKQWLMVCVVLVGLD